MFCDQLVRFSVIIGKHTQCVLVGGEETGQQEKRSKGNHLRKLTVQGNNIGSPVRERLAVYLKNAPVDIPVCIEIPKYVTAADFRL